ncbi:MAG: cytochrome c oxidase subunit 2A [Acidimicrobiia bacterium]|nr:cytochrome c oxidase subunit 2A [Acidimicrobiia bacterium]NNK91681.1 cytochrome c oxidase subunit 2A [Acidimicrobiia bacterium]
MTDVTDGAVPGAEDEHFKPIGTWFVLGVFVATIILLWLSVYVILLARGVTT